MGRDKYSHFIFLPFLCLSFLSTCVGQYASYSVIHYTTENGLPQNSVTGMVMDKNGFLWLSTQDGICRYDGSAFREYNMSNTASITSNRFSNVYSMKNSNITFIQYYALKKFFSVGPNYGLQVDSTMTKEKYFEELQPRYCLIGGFPKEIKFSGKVEAAVFKSKGEAFRYTLNLGKLCYADTVYKKNYPLFSINGKTTINVITASDMFMVMGNQYVRHVNIKAGIYNFPIEKNVSIGPQTSIVKNKWQQCLAMRKDIIVFFKNNIYICYNEDGQIKKELLFKDFKLTLQLKNSLALVEFDKVSHTLFIGSNVDGLYVLKPKQFQQFLPNSTKTSVGAQIMLDNGHIIGGNEHYYIKKKEKMPFERVDRNAFFKDTNNTILFSKNNGLFRSDKEFKISKKLGQLNNDNKDPYEARAFLRDHSGKIWFSNNYGFGIIAGDSLLFKQQHVFNFDNYIAYLFEQSKDTLWILTKEAIYTYTPKNNQLQSKPLMSGFTARYAYRARDSSIWLGTYGKGFYKYQHGRFIAMPMDAKCYLLNAHSFYEDNNGYFWIPTNNGLFQCLKSELDAFAVGSSIKPYYFRYKNDDGFATNEFNGGFTPAYIYNKGELTYPSIYGVVYFFPDSIKPLLPINPMFIDQLFVDEKPIFQSNGCLSLSPDFNQFKIMVVCAFWGSTENLVMEYRLEELNDQWHPIAYGNTILFNRLPHGNYTLRIRKQEGFGINRFTYKTLSFKVLPYWYENWWSRLLLLLALIFVVGFFFLMRLKENKRSAAMEAMMTEQKLKALRAQINPHFIQNTFQFLAHQMVTSSRDRAIDAMHQVSSYLRNVLYHSNKQVLSLEDELEFTREYLQVQQLVINIPFQFELTVMEDVDIYDIQVPSMLIQPVVENALKYGLDKDSDKNFIHITISGDADYIFCTVSDGGSGKGDMAKPEGHKSMGLNITMERMKLLYKNTKLEPSVQKSINSSGGWDVLIKIPQI